jgi:hypothetical protein
MWSYHHGKSDDLATLAIVIVADRPTLTFVVVGINCIDLLVALHVLYLKKIE